MSDEGRVVEKGGGDRSLTLWCGHRAEDDPRPMARHPKVGNMYRCPRCKRVLPAR